MKGPHCLPPDENGFRRWYEGDEFWEKHRREKRFLKGVVGCWFLLVFGGLALLAVLSVLKAALS